MKIALYYHAVLPIKKYGGSERVVMWLAKGLAELGHQVYLMSFPGSEADFARCIWVSSQEDMARKLPEGIEVMHMRTGPRVKLPCPVLVTLGGNYFTGETFNPNTSFLSRDHARRHNAKHYVYNGLDVSEYTFNPNKSDYFLFLSKVRWSVKGIGWALEVAKRTGINLVVAGGRRLNFRRNVTYVGMVGGQEKRDLLAGAKALIFPTLWPEPFGNVVIEAMASGTPVITTNNGSMPELIPSAVGFRCDSVEEMCRAVERIDEVAPAACRQRVEQQFNHIRLAEDYLKLYQRLIDHGTILEPGESPPKAPTEQSW